METENKGLTDANVGSPPNREKKVLIPMGEKSAVGGGALAQMITDHGITQLSNQVYNMILGVNPAIISTVFGVVRLWDAITDPLMGSISDNTRTRFGRRRQYLVLGAVLCAVGFPLVWFVPTGWNEKSMAAYFVVATFVFYTFATIYSVSFQALLTEMTPDYDERTKVTSFAYFFQSLGWILFPVVFWVAQFEIFPDKMSGIRIVGIVVGVLIGTLGVVCALKAKERYHTIAAKQIKVPMGRSIKSTLKNKPFLILIGISVFMLLGHQMVNTLGYYLNVYYVNEGDLKEGARFAVIMSCLNIPLSMVVAIVVGQKFAHIDKKTILLAGMSLALLGTLSKWFLITPEHPYWQVIPPLLMSPGNACFWMLMPSLRADVCDDDEIKTGTRSEGMYSSVHSWVIKLSFSIVIGISGYILVFVGFDQSFGGEQLDKTFFYMRFLYAFVPSISIVVGIILLFKYPLTKERMRATREELECRRDVPEAV